MIDEPGIHPPAINEELSHEMLRYRGEWVAIERDEIVAHGDRAVDVRDEAVAIGALDPEMFHVPKWWGNMTIY